MKPTKSMTVATALLVASQAVVAQAEEVTPPTPANVPGQTQTVTQEDVTAITQEADQAKAAVQNQEDVVKQAQAAHQAAQSQLATANQNLSEAEEQLNKATPQAIEAVETSITEAQAQLPGHQAAIAQAEADKVLAAADVTAQEQVVLAKGQELKVAQDQMAQAKQGVDTAQAILDGTGTKAILEEVKAATDHQAVASQAVTSAQTTLQLAQKADQERQVAITEAETKSAVLTADLGQKEQDLTKANQILAQTQETLTQAQIALTQATNEVNALNTLTLTPAYVADLKAFVAGGFLSDESTQAEKRLMAANKELVALNPFKPNANDDQTKLDPRHLTTGQREELTHFAVDLINQIRRQMGTGEAVAHRQVIDLAESIADRYEAANWDWNQSITVSPHYREAIKEAAQTAGLRASTHYENIHTIGTMYQPITSLTMGELKEKVHQAVINFMFNGQEYFHALSVSAAPGYGQPSRYMGVAFSNRSDAFSIHLIGVDEASIDASGSFDPTATVSTPRTSEAIRAAYQLAQTNLTTAQTAHQQAQSAQTLADLEVTATKNQLVSARQSLTEVLTKGLQTPSAQVKLNQAQTALELANQRLDQAKQAEANLSADVATKRQALTDAQEILKSAQAKRDQLQEASQLEQETLQSLKEKVTQADQALTFAKEGLAATQANITQLEEKLANLLDAPNRLRQAKEGQRLALANEQDSHEVWLKEVAKLKELATASDQLETKRLALSTAYQSYLTAQEKERKAREASQLPRHQVLAVYGQATPSGSQLAYGKPSPASLPKTGDTGSLLTLVGGMLSTLSVLVLRKKHRR